jgi:hypothetical protein
MKKLRGLDTHLIPAGFWDRFITFNILALVAIGLHWWSASNGSIDRIYLIGLLIGLPAGQAAVCVSKLAETFPEKRNVLYWLYLALSVVLFFLFIFIFRSAPLAFAYFLGLSTTLFFGSALAALLTRYPAKKIRDETGDD